MSDHCPSPTWDCRACGKDWPCDPAREALRIQYRNQPGKLAVFMYRKLEAAAPALTASGMSRGEMWDRFIEWTKPVPLDVP